MTDDIEIQVQLDSPSIEIDLGGPPGPPTPTDTVQAMIDASIDDLDLGSASQNETADFDPAGSASAALTAAQAYAESLVVGLWDDRGAYDASGNTYPATGGSGSAGAIRKGDIWTISVAGTLGGVAVTAGDTVRALADAPGQTAGNWAIAENNIGYVPLNRALNLSDIPSPATARTNLGLGSAAVESTSAFDVAGAAEALHNKLVVTQPARNFRLAAVSDTGHTSTYDYTQTNGPAGGLTDHGTGGWAALVASGHSISFAFPNWAMWGDSHAFYDASGTFKTILENTFNLNIRQAGIGGQQTQEVLARFAADVLPLNPAIITISAGTNDVNLALPAQNSLDVMKANALALVDAALSTGAVVIYELPGPYTPPAFDTLLPLSQMLILKQFNDWMEDVFRGTGVIVHNILREYCVDYAANTAAGFAWAMPEMYSDTLHRNATGTLTMKLAQTAKFGAPLYLKSIGLNSFSSTVNPMLAVGAPAAFTIDFGLGGTVKTPYLHGSLAPSIICSVPNASAGVGVAVTGGLKGAVVKPTSAVGGAASVGICNAFAEYSAVPEYNRLKGLGKEAAPSATRFAAGDQSLPGSAGGTLTTLTLGTVSISDANVFSNPGNGQIQINQNGRYHVELKGHFAAGGAHQFFGMEIDASNFMLAASSPNGALAAFSSHYLSCSADLNVTNAPVVITARAINYSSTNAAMLLDQTSTVWTVAIDDGLANSLTVTRLER